MPFSSAIGRTLAGFAAAIWWSAQSAAATWCAEPAPGGLYGCSSTSIQAAIDAAGPGDTIDVYPGAYLEKAGARDVAALGGPHRFGLHIAEDKNGLRIQGVDATGKPIEDWRNVQAFIMTDAVNDLGPSGIFVEADGVTLRGLNIGTNLRQQDKTIEIVGDALTLQDCDISDRQGSIYIHDPRFEPASNISHVKSYLIENNNFQSGVSIDVASGAGLSGPVSGREIKGNIFSNAGYWPSISFNGAGTGVSWFDQPVGGAIIQDNTFHHTFAADPSHADYELHLKTQGYIRARGSYEESQLDWTAYFNANKFDHAYMTYTKQDRKLRAYSYASGSHVFENVRRIGALLEGERAIAQPEDRIFARLHRHGWSPRGRHLDRDGVEDRPMAAPEPGRF